MSVEPTEGLVSVVVAAFDVVDYLADAAASVLAQEGVDLELVVVDDGSTDGTAELVDQLAASDPRVVALHQENAGLAAARNAGIAVARGEFLTFCDADDVVRPGAYAAMRDSLLASGSDFVIARTERFDSRSRWQPVWIDEVHDGAPWRGLRIEDRPVAIKNILECNRMYRRAAWDAVGPFPVGGYSEGYEPMVASFLEGRTFDLVDDVAYAWRVRDDGSSSTQQKARTPSLRDRLAAIDRVAARLDAHGSPRVTSAWHARVLELDLSGYYRFAHLADAEFRSLLAGAAHRFLELADDDALRLVSVHRKVSAWLAATERWDDLEWIESRAGRASLRQSAHLESGWPTADAGELARRIGAEVPREILALSHYDTSVRTAVAEAHPTTTPDGAPALELVLDVWLRGVKQPEDLGSVNLEVRVVGAPEHEPLVVPVRHEGRRALAVVDVEAVREWIGRPTARLELSAAVTWGDVARSGPLVAQRARVLASAGGVVVRGRPGRAVTLRARRRPLAVQSLSVTRSAAVVRLADGTVRTLPLPRGRRPVTPRLRAPDGGRSALAWPRDEVSGVVEPRGLLARRVPWRWEVGAGGEARLAPRGDGPSTPGSH